jgi:hypothetical protein
MAATTEDASLAKSEEKESLDSESTSLAKGKQIITHTEATDLLALNPTDIDQSIYVKVYRKWTTINKASVPSMYSCILIDQQVQSYIQAKS